MKRRYKLTVVFNSIFRFNHYEIVEGDVDTQEFRRRLRKHLKAGSVILDNGDIVPVSTIKCLRVKELIVGGKC